ncbi:MAG: hypothetical protein H6Q74_93 [Firmicutes bacterium]|nr:hypothetical protein [Bacillota bacterium]
MKKILRRFVSGIISIITTFLVMAAPVAVLVYSADGVTEQAGKITYLTAPIKYDNVLTKQTKANKVYVVKSAGPVLLPQDMMVEHPLDK